MSFQLITADAKYPYLPASLSVYDFRQSCVRPEDSGEKEKGRERADSKRERERKERETLKPDLSCPRLIENRSQAVLVCRSQQLFIEAHMDSNNVQVQQSSLGHVVLHGTKKGAKTHWGGFAKYIYLYCRQTDAHTFFQPILSKQFHKTVQLLCEPQTSQQTSRPPVLSQPMLSISHKKINILDKTKVNKTIWKIAQKKIGYVGMTADCYQTTRL